MKLSSLRENFIKDEDFINRIMRHYKVSYKINADFSVDVDDNMIIDALDDRIIDADGKFLINFNNVSR